MRFGLLLLTLCLAAPLQVATAQDPASSEQVPLGYGSEASGSELRQRWPEALHYRNARYANLEREIDTPGDHREAVLADLYLAPIMTYLSRMPEGPELLDGRANIHRAGAAMMARPSYQNTLPPMAQAAE